MAPDDIRQIFKGLEPGAGAAFLDHVAEPLTCLCMRCCCGTCRTLRRADRLA